METTNDQNIPNRIVDAMKTALAEVEEFRLQAALGKAEARDLFEESKIKFNAFINQAKRKFENIQGKSASENTSLKQLFETLELQLKLGKAETMVIFEEQVKRITRLMDELETMMRNSKTAVEYYAGLHTEIEKFRIKLEIIKLRYGLKKIEAGVNFEKRKSEFISKLDELKAKMAVKMAENNDNWQNFREEMTEAYRHFRNAFIH